MRSGSRRVRGARRRRAKGACRSRLLTRLPAVRVRCRGGARSASVALGVTALGAAVLADLGGPAAAVVAVVLTLLGWLLLTLRFVRISYRGGLPPPGGGPAGVREPRRPRPRPPAGALALALPVEPQDDAVACA